MAICDPYDSHIDFCWAAGGDSTEDHTKCYTALDDHDDYGERELYGCDAGCIPCKDYPSEIVAQVTHEGGRRWLRAHPTERNRDAWGNIHDLMSSTPHPIPSDGVFFQRGQCFSQARGGPRQSGEECFGMGPCRCWRGASLETDESGYCAGGALVGDPVEEGHFYDALFFKGFDWPPRAIEGGIHCRKFNEINARTIPAIPDNILGMPAPVLLRYGQFASDEGSSPCMPNAFVPCLGRPRDTSACLGEWRADPRWFEQQLDPPIKWLENQTPFNYLEFTENSARITPTPLSTPMDHATINLKNVAMNHVKDTTFTTQPHGNPVRFNRVERARNMYDGSAIWTRSYNRAWGPDQQDCGQLFYDPATLIRTFPYCKTAEGGDQVTMQWYVLSVRYTILLIAQKYFLGEEIGQYSIDRMEYHARAQISIECAWVGSSPTVQIEHDSNCFVLPKVTGDRIIYKDNNGRVFSPIQRIVWLGYLGRLGVEGTERVPIWLGGTVNNQCSVVHDHVSDNPIRGWPVLALNTPSNPSGHYAGQLRVEFRQ